MRSSKKGYNSIALSRRRRKWTKKFFDKCMDFTNIASLLMLSDNTGHHGYFYLHLSSVSPLIVWCKNQIQRLVRRSAWPCTTALPLSGCTMKSSGSSTHSCSTPKMGGQHEHARRRMMSQWLVVLGPRGFQSHWSRLCRRPARRQVSRRLSYMAHVQARLL